MEIDKLTEIAATVNELFLKLSRTEQRVSVQLYRLLAEGMPVSPKQIAAELRLSDDIVKEILNRWWGVYCDSDRIIGYWGLSLAKTAHQFKVNGRMLYTWCAWDSLFIPEIVDQSARFESQCPVTQFRIRLTVAPQGIIELEPTGAVMSFVTPEAARIRDNVVAHFCHHVHFFSSAEAGAKWVAQHPGTFLLSMNDAYSLGRMRNAALYEGIF